MADVPLVRFEPPGPDSPGHLRRARQAMVFSETMDSGDMTVELMDSMVAFLAQWVSVPEEQDAKIDALWECSKNQYKELIQVLIGSAEEDSEGNPT